MSRVIDPFDELAQLFLTDSEDESADPREAKGTRGSSRAAAPIELLLVGHLPVRADLWLRPYAEAMARKESGAALVRLDADEPSVEALGCEGSIALDGADRSLHHALARLASHVKLWIVRPSGQATAESIVSAQADRITIISSADEAALVAAYQRIKDLADAAQERGEPLPKLGIAILGSAESVARSMVDRLNRTTRTFLGIELPMVATLQQMEAGSRSQAYARFLGERSPGVEDVVTWLHELPVSEAAADAARTTTAEPATVAPMPAAPPSLRPPTLAAPTPGAPQTDAHSFSELDDREIDDAFAAMHEAIETVAADSDDQEVEVDNQDAGIDDAIDEAGDDEASLAEADSHAPSAWRVMLPGDEDVIDLLQPARPSASDRAHVLQASPTAGRSAKLAPKPSMLHEPKEPRAEREPAGAAGEVRHLAEFVSGLQPIALRCPGCERVELAIDSLGRFHLLCREDAMRELHLVEAWTRSHRALLAMALPSHAIDAESVPALHVFTEAPVSVSDLHGSSLHLHVLAPVQVDGRTGWYAAPLNKPH